jgi:hypothetical protein
MEKSSTLRIPGTLKHSNDARTDADLVKELRAYLGAQPGVRFLADVLTALHASPHPLRFARAFYAACPPRVVLQAFAERPELRARLLRAITGGPPALLRRIPPAELASQIELLAAEDLPAGERTVRAEEDRQLAVVDLYLKYLDPSDLAAYLPPAVIWEYESHDGWWKREASATTKALMVAELKSIRRNGVLPDSDILDMIGDETLERDLPLPVRTRLRGAARKAARDGRPFRDSDMFTSLRSEDGTRDLIDELVDHVAFTSLRRVVARAAEILGLGGNQPAAAVLAAGPAVEMKGAVPVTLLPRGRQKGGAEAPAAARPRQETERLVVAPAPANDDAPVPTADELPAGFDDDVIDNDTLLMIEEAVRR